MADDVQAMYTATQEELFMLGSRTPLRGGWTGPIADPDNSSGRPTLSFIRILNTVTQELQRETNFNIVTTSVNLVVGQQSYTVPGSGTTHKILSVAHNGIRMRRTRMKTMDRKEPLWRNMAAGHPRRYMRWSMSDFTVLPAPDATAFAAAGSVSMYISKVPAVLTLSNQVVNELVDAFQYLLPQRCALKVCSMDRANQYNEKRYADLKAENDEGTAFLAKYVKDEFGFEDDNTDEDDPYEVPQPMPR